MAEAELELLRPHGRNRAFDLADALLTNRFECHGTFDVAACRLSAGTPRVGGRGGEAFSTGPPENGLLDKGSGDENAAERILFEDFLPIQGLAVRGRVLPEPLGVGARRVLVAGVAAIGRSCGTLQE